MNAAVSNGTGEIDFYVCQESFDSRTWAWGFAGVKNGWYTPDTYNTIKVPAVKLSSYINQPIDLLKIDIEGMEDMVLNEIEGKLKFIKDIRMEYHGSAVSDEINSIERIVSIANRNDLKIMITQNGKIIRFDQIEKEDMYSLLIYINRQRLALWWQAVALPQMNRLWRLFGKLRAMMPHRSHSDQYILHMHHRDMYMPHTR